jgi:FAD/FMN-containing dehydrogenase
MEVRHIEFSNWSRQYKSMPSVYAIPETPEDLQEIVRNNMDFPSPVVAVGSGHTNSGCNVMRKVTAVYMKKIHFIHEPTENDITVGGAVELIEVHRFLAKRQKQLPFTPEIGNATLGSVACCTLKDASPSQSSGIAAGMIKVIKFMDASGNQRSM